MCRKEEEKPRNERCEREIKEDEEEKPEVNKRRRREEGREEIYAKGSDTN